MIKEVVMTRGVVYVVWGEWMGGETGGKVYDLLERSRESLRSFHPDIPVTVVHADSSFGLLNKPKELSRLGSGRDVTLYLDADTVVCGNLDAGFEYAEEYGLACCIGEHPWLRRYRVPNHPSSCTESIEYNTGIIFWSAKGQSIIDSWGHLAATGKFSPSSRICFGSEVVEMPGDDQYSFGVACRQSSHHPFVLPMNYNFRMGWHTRLVLPLKVWHAYQDVHPDLLAMSKEVEAGRKPTTLVELYDSSQAGIDVETSHGVENPAPQASEEVKA